MGTYIVAIDETRIQRYEFHVDAMNVDEAHVEAIERYHAGLADVAGANELLEWELVNTHHVVEPEQVEAVWRGHEESHLIDA